jgi:hypothetical protein
MLTIAATIAVNAVHDHAGSALPNAPVVPDRPARTHAHLAAFLRASAVRRQRPADRLDPRSRRAEPVTG